MNIFRKYTLENLKKNKVRTIITIIGIILSVAMFTATTESFVTVQNFLIDYAVKTNGTYHVSFHGIDDAQLERITSDKRITAFTKATDIGYAEIDSLNKDKPYIYIAGIPEDYRDISAITVLDGRMPENDSEIIVSQHINSNGLLDIKTGDTLELEVGQRQWNELIGISEDAYNELDGNNWQKLNQEATYKGESESLINTNKKTYTVVGICERSQYNTFEPYSAPGFTAYTLLNEETKGLNTLFCVLENPSEFNDVIRAYSEEGSVKKNSDLLMFLLVLHDNAFEGLFIGLGAVLIFIIVFGSVALIFNSFSISLSERTKQYGLLRSIGATKKQVMKSVLFEAIVLCTVGVPLGLISGCLGLFITFKALGPVITNLMSQFTRIELRLSLTPLALLISALIGTLTVLISAYIPARRALKTTPVDAVRQNKDIKINKKQIKISPLTKKLFGLEGVVSAKNFKRNKKKYTVTVFSLFVSVVMFISASSLASYFTATLNAQAQDMKYDISLIQYTPDLNNEERKNLIDAINSVTVKDDYAINNTYYDYVDIATDMFSQEYKAHYSSFYEINGEELRACDITINFINDEAFRKYLTENGIKEDAYFNKNSPKALLWDNITMIYQQNGKQHIESFSFFDKANLPGKIDMIKTEDIEGYFIESRYEENGINYIKYRKAGNEGEDISQNPTIILTADEAITKYSIEVGAVLTEKPYFVNDRACFIFPESMKDSTVFKDRDFDIYAYFLSKEHKTTETQLRKSLIRYGIYEKFSCYNYATDIETVRGIVIISKVFAYGFIILISLIAAANVFNTISTNIALRRREFATLSSVGLSVKGLYKMMMYESLLYGIKSLVFSLPCSALITFVIYLIVNNSGYGIDFYIPWGNFIIAILSVFIIVFISMFYSIKKIRKNNIADTLRDENI